jgi:hypothetical protein
MEITSDGLGQLWMTRTWKEETHADAFSKNLSSMEPSEGMSELHTLERKKSLTEAEIALHEAHGRALSEEITKVDRQIASLTKSLEVKTEEVPDKTAPADVQKPPFLVNTPFDALPHI